MVLSYDLFLERLIAEYVISESGIIENVFAIRRTRVPVAEDIFSLPYQETHISVINCVC